MKKDEEVIEPELDITDDMPDVPDAEKEAPTQSMTPEQVIEQEPTTVGLGANGEPRKPSFGQKVKSFLGTKKGKVITIITGVVIVVGGILAIPVTRYGVLGIVVKKDVTVTVIDRSSKKPISGAVVTLGTAAVTSDAKGVATLPSIPVGQYDLRVEKKYYESASGHVAVPILSAPSDPRPELKATGRSVEIVVTNKITGSAVEGAAVTISESAVTTSEKGAATIILPVKNEAQKGSVKVKGYNDATFELKVENKDGQKLAVSLIPNGTIYFLSKRTGTVDVMKSSLDGSDAHTIVAGTGQENDASTVLLATTDWKYLALQASRDSDVPKLYLIDTTSGKLTIMDESSADFQLVGWSGHSFVYQASRRSSNIWDDKRSTLKSFNAESGKLTTLDETEGSGSSYYDYAAQNIGNVYIADGTVIYTKNWDISQYATPGDRQSSILSVGVGGGSKKSLKDFPATQVAYFEAKLYRPAEVYFRVIARADSKATYYEYEDGKVTETGDTNDAKFYNGFYATYLISPSGTKTLWYEQRDGKNVIFVGDKTGSNGREIGIGEFTPYGWYGDDYILLSKKSSELYAFSAAGTFSESAQPQKVTDYHKPALSFPGYGSGYGGL